MQPKCPWPDEWVKKQWYSSSVQYYTAVKKKKKKEELVPSATAWIDLEIILLSEISQSGNKNTTRSDLYLESNEQNKLMNKIETESQRQRTDWQLSEWSGTRRRWGDKPKNTSVQLIHMDNSAVMAWGRREARTGFGWQKGEKWRYL